MRETAPLCPPVPLSNRFERVSDEPSKKRPHTATGSAAPKLERPLLTIFALPKAFTGHIGLIQNNALASWVALAPDVEVILFGDDPGAAEAAAKHGVTHVPEIGRNDHGTPRLDHLFAEADRRAAGRLLCYVNADLILLPDFVTAAARVAAEFDDSFLMIGRRIDTDITREIDFPTSVAERSASVAAITAEVNQTGHLAPVVCKDYFCFPKGLFATIPAFAIGRGNWDNWMVAGARNRGIPVVDVTAVTHVVHQNHGHGHVAGNKLAAYVSGPEAEANRALAGGRNLIRGSTATHGLTARGIVRRRLPDVATFASDLPRFMILMAGMVGLWPFGNSAGPKTPPSAKPVS